MTSASENAAGAFDVFISYAHADRARAQALAGAIAASGYAVWLDNDAIRDGEAFDLQIEDAIARSRCVVVLWSVAAVKSRWVRAEAAYALERGKLVPILLDGAEPPLQFLHIQAIDFYGWDMAQRSPQMLRLLDSLSIRLRHGQVASAEQLAQLNVQAGRWRHIGERLFLAFSDPATERNFGLYYRERVYSAARFAILLGAMAFAMLGLADALGPGGSVAATRLRFLVICPVLLVFYQLSSLNWVKARWEAFLSLFAFVSLGLTLQLILQLETRERSVFQAVHNYGSIIFMLVTAFLPLLQLRTLHSVVIAIAAVAVHGYYTIVFARHEPHMLYMVNLFVGTSALVACCTAYWRERSHRKAFASR